MQAHTLLRVAAPAVKALHELHELAEAGNWDPVLQAVAARPWTPLVAARPGGAEDEAAVVSVPTVLATLPTDTYNMTLLHWAASGDSSDSVTALMAHLTEVSGQTPDRVSGMVRAVVNLAGRNPLELAEFTWEKNTRVLQAHAAAFSPDSGTGWRDAYRRRVRPEQVQCLLDAAVAAVLQTSLFSAVHPVLPVSAAADADLHAALRRGATDGSSDDESKSRDTWAGLLAVHGRAQQERKRWKSRYEPVKEDAQANGALRRNLWHEVLRHVGVTLGPDAGNAPFTLDVTQRIEGSGPRWGAQCRYPSYRPLRKSGDSAATAAAADDKGLNLRFWGAVVNTVEMLARSGAWLFWRGAAGIAVAADIADHARRSAAAGAASPAAPISLLAFGDWGDECDGLRTLEKNMKVVGATAHPAAVCVLGDNFYPSGISSVHEPRVARQFRNRFVRRDKRQPDQPHGLEATPFAVVQGNHDYHSPVDVQVDFNDVRSANADGAWRSAGDDPAVPPYRMYTLVFHGADFDVHLFMFDVNAVQFSVRRTIPDIQQRYATEDLPWLRREVQASRAAEAQSGRRTWRIVTAHQPMFTNGRGHANEGRCLQGPTYEAIGRSGVMLDGMDLQKEFDELGVHAYIAGHEHTNQFTRRSYRHSDCLHAVVGASVENHFYKGELFPEDRMVDKVLPGTGFCSLSGDASRLELSFWRTDADQPQPHRDGAKHRSRRSRGDDGGKSGGAVAPTVVLRESIVAADAKSTPPPVEAAAAAAA